MALYEDIGGARTVRAALDAFYARVLADATLYRPRFDAIPWPPPSEQSAATPGG